MVWKLGNGDWLSLKCGGQLILRSTLPFFFYLEKCILLPVQGALRFHFSKWAFHSGQNLQNTKQHLSHDWITGGMGLFLI